MNDSLPSVIVALRRESLFFRKTHRPRQRIADAPCWAARTDSLLLVETGVGQARVARVLDWLLGRRPPWLVFAGFAGSLSPSLTVGDVLTAEAVIDEQGRSWPTTWPTNRSGRLLTTAHLIATAAAKRALGAQHQAVAVDMESATFARRCTEAGVPFGCVRAVSDDMDTPLSPELVPLLAGGVVSPWRFAALLARRPGMLPELLRLARDTKIAARRLAAALNEIISAAA